MSPRTIDVEAHTVDDRPTMTVPQVKLPLWLTIGGFIGLLLGIILPLGAFGSMAVVLVSTAVLICGYILIRPTPHLLILPHIAVIVFLTLQLGGLCQWSCGSFGIYARIASVPTVVFGIGFHAACLVVLWWGLRGGHPQLIRMAAGFAEGAGLFFAVHLIEGGHWCPSCAASHAVMLTQGVALLRLTPARHLQRFWLAMIAIGFLSTNLAFHHREPPVQLQAGDRLLGLLESAARSGTFHKVVVKPAVVDVSPHVEATRSVNPSAPSVMSKGSQPPTAQATPLTVARPPANRVSDPTTAGLLSQAPVARPMDFDIWGHAEAKLTAKLSMSLVCPHCREHWPILSQALRGRSSTLADGSAAEQTAKALGVFLAPRVREGGVRLQFVLNWPLQPEAHHGARLATYVTYAAGALGEDELFAALEVFFSSRGLQLMQVVNQQLMASEIHGRISPEVEQEALVALIQAVEGIEPQRLAAAYRVEKAFIDTRFRTNIDWLLANGDLGTPRYYFLSGDPSGPAILDASTLDPEVWSAFVTKAASP
jgi:hypothetical protein